MMGMKGQRGSAEPERDPYASVAKMILGNAPATGQGVKRDGTE